MKKKSNNKSAGGRREFLQSALGVAGVSLLESRVFPMSHLQLHSPDAAHSAVMMSTATEAFISSLSPDQRARATFAFEDEQRLDWHFIPRVRKGIPSGTWTWAAAWVWPMLDLMEPRRRGWAGLRPVP